MNWKTPSIDLDAGAEDNGVLSQVLGNNQVFVLDDDLQLAPVGIPGELYLGGAQLCRGYLNAEADAQAFIQSPFDARQQLYRTGDLARYRLDLASRCNAKASRVWSLTIRLYRGWRWPCALGRPAPGNWKKSPRSGCDWTR